MGAGRFKIVVPNNPSYPNQVIVYGPRLTLEALGLPPNFRHAASTHPLLEKFGLRNILRESVDSAAFTVGVNAIDYSIGENAEYGIISTRHAAANTVDLTTGVGLPAMLAVIGSTVGPEGTTIGFGTGVIADITFGVAFPEQHDAAVVWVDNQVYTPSAIYVDAHVVQPSISCGTRMMLQLENEIYRLYGVDRLYGVGQ